MLIVEIAKSRYADAFEVQLDLLPKAQLLQCIDNFWDSGGGSNSKRFCDLVNPVILHADGSLYPHSYGISNKYKISSGDLDSFDSGIQEYAKSGLSDFKELTKRCASRLLLDDSEVIDWYKMLVWESSQAFEPKSEKVANEFVVELDLR